MKKILSLTICLLCIANAHSQTFKSLGTDPKGDAQGETDIKAVSYSIDAAKDSIWFKLELHDAWPENRDFGLMVGIDTDMVKTNGLTWPGNNSSMKYDHALFVMQNATVGGAGSYYAMVGEPGNPAMDFTASIKRPDAYTFIIRTKLSTLDKDSKFNLLIGTAPFDVGYTGNLILDETPESGLYSIPGSSTNIKTASNLLREARLYPNPSNGMFILSGLTLANEPLSINIINMYGQSVFDKDIAPGKAISQLQLDLRQLSTGNYKMHLTTNKSSNTLNFVVN